MIFSRACPRSRAAHVDQARARRIGTVVGLFTGGVIGALLLRLGPGPALLSIAGLQACVAALYSRAPRLRPPANAGH